MRSGDRTGELTLLRSYVIGSGGRRFWVCSCSCGKVKDIRQDALQRGATRSCGHLQLAYAKSGDAHRIHGMTGTPIWYTWKGMHRRCYDPLSKSYPDYGARGITVSAEWHDFQTFCRDMGDKPTEGHSLERRDNSRGYSRENCYWSTRVEQNRNTRRTRWVEVGGRSISLAEAAEVTGINYGTLKSRLNRGWSVERALIK